MAQKVQAKRANQASQGGQLSRRRVKPSAKVVTPTGALTGMGNGCVDRPMATRKSRHWPSLPTLAVLGIFAVYILTAFTVVNHYGLVSHGEQCIGLGHKYLHYYATGELDFDNIQHPVVPGVNMALFYDALMRVHPSDFYPFDALLSAITCKIFYEKLHVLDHFAAHAMFLPFVTSLACWFLYRFLSRCYGAVVGVLTVAILLTIPRFFGHTMFNIRAEVTVTAMFVLTVVFLAEWFQGGRPRWLYFSAVVLSCGLATKPDAIFAPILVGLWQLPALVRKGLHGDRPRLTTVLHLLGAAALVVVVYIALYPPLHPWHTGQFGFLEHMLKTMRANAFWPTTSWNLYAPTQLLYIQPILLLGLAIGGIGYAGWFLRLEPVTWLILLWAILPVARHCLPHANHYDGERHFFFFYPAFAVLAAWCLDGLASGIGRITHCPRGRTAVSLGLVVVAANVWGIAEMHPYEYAFNNSLIGGVRGAVMSNFPYAGDYMQCSMRETSRWLDRYAAPNAHVYSTLNNPVYSLTRTDLSIIPQFNKPEDIPPNSYLVVVLHDWWGGVTFQYPYRRLFIMSNYQRVYQIQRQGGEIAAIYYKR